jgi:hypothetical protein
MMRALSPSPFTPFENYTAALLSTRALHHAHRPILAGTDANEAPEVSATVPFGSSMHEERYNLVEEGLSNVAATRYLGLRDRGGSGG